MFKRVLICCYFLAFSFNVAYANSNLFGIKLAKDKCKDVVKRYNFSSLSNNDFGHDTYKFVSGQIKEEGAREVFLMCNSKGVAVGLFFNLESKEKYQPLFHTLSNKYNIVVYNKSNGNQEAIFEGGNLLINLISKKSSNDVILYYTTKDEQKKILNSVSKRGV